MIFLDTTGAFLSQVAVGATPKMITFNQAGTKLLVANEGAPNTSYTADPESSISIIDLSGGVLTISASNVTTAAFTAFNSQSTALEGAGVRLFGNNASVAQDMEPEHIAISADDATAYVTCQENNAVAVISIATATVTDIIALGTKNHLLSGNALDANNQSNAIQIANYPVKGMYQPSGIASNTVGGQNYLITANEGAARTWNALNETVRVSDTSYVLDSTAFPYAEALKGIFGRLQVSNMTGDSDNDGDFDEIHSFGGRSFSIWNATTGSLVYDSGDDFELITAKHPSLGAIFNPSNANNTPKDKSDEKGPEPKSVTTATLNSNTYAFVSLKGIGGAMLNNITNPVAPVFEDYKNTRNTTSYGGDNGSSGVIFIPAANSPNAQPLVILANETSASLSIYQVNATPLNIKLADINAQSEGNRNKIEWIVEETADIDRFEVEKSAEGIQFSKMSTVKTERAQTYYTHFDTNPLPSRNFYRLKMISHSGEFNYSKVVVAEQSTEHAFALYTYPIPFSNELSIVTKGTRTTPAKIEILDMRGLTVRSFSPTSEATTISTADLAVGIYALRYPDPRTTIVIKITKQTARRTARKKTAAAS